MDGGWATLIVGIASILINLIIVGVNLYSQANRDLLKMRSLPVVSIWDNAKDKVDERLRDSVDRVFFKLEEKAELRKYRFFYFVIKNTSSHNVVNCSATISNSGEVSNTCRIGFIARGSKVVIPVRIHGGNDKLKCEINYTTEGREMIDYTTEAEIKQLPKRDDYYIIQKCVREKRKKKITINTNLSESHLAKEFFDDDKEFSFELGKNGAADAA